MDALPIRLKPGCDEYKGCPKRR